MFELGIREWSVFFHQVTWRVNYGLDRVGVGRKSLNTLPLNFRLQSAYQLVLQVECKDLGVLAVVVSILSKNRVVKAA